MLKNPHVALSTGGANAWDERLVQVAKLVLALVRDWALSISLTAADHKRQVLCW